MQRDGDDEPQVRHLDRLLDLDEAEDTAVALLHAVADARPVSFLELDCGGVREREARGPMSAVEHPHAWVVRNLVVAAAELAACLVEAVNVLRGDEDEHVRRAGGRLDEAVGYARRAREITARAAAELDAIAAVPADACRIGWPVCPDHGNTLTMTGDGASCRTRGCRRTWEADPSRVPCPYPAAYVVTGPNGETGRMCRGHALGAVDAVPGVSVVPPLETSGGVR